MSKILGNGKPTNKTPGIVGQEYIDKLTGTSYMCTKVNHVTGDRSGESDAVYIWEKIELNHTLVGEVEFTSQNCTVMNGNTIVFNSEIQSVVRSIFDELKDRIGAVLIRSLALDSITTGYASYFPASSLNKENLQYSGIADPVLGTFSCFSLQGDRIVASDTRLASVITEGYPLTLKVYTI